MEDRRLLDQHTTFVREMEQDLRASRATRQTPPQLEPDVRLENNDIPRIARMQIDLMVNGFAADFTRVATLQFTNSVGMARMNWIQISAGHHELAHRPDNERTVSDQLTRFNRRYCEQPPGRSASCCSAPRPSRCEPRAAW